MRGVRVALDIGKARIGVAKSDPDGLLASPYETVTRRGEDQDFFAKLLAIITELEPIVVYIGDPVNLRGKRTESTDDAREIAQKLQKKGVNVRLIDERFTTVSAQKKLHETGRNTKTSRSIIDQAAAAVMLEYALESERTRGSVAGTAP